VAGAALGTGVGLRAPCNIYSDAPVRTGSLPGCVSDVGAFDMVGNVQEMVAEWGVRGADCTTWPAAFGSDYACFGAGPVLLPAHISRGGSFSEGTGAGVFAATTRMGPPSAPDYAVGLRCVADLESRRSVHTAALLASDGRQGVEFRVTFARHDLHSCDAVLVGQIKPGTASGKQLEVLVIRPLLQHHVRCGHASSVLRVDVGADASIAAAASK